MKIGGLFAWVGYLVVTGFAGAQAPPPSGVTAVDLIPLREFLEVADSSEKEAGETVRDLTVRFDPNTVSEPQAQLLAKLIVKTERQRSLPVRFEVFSSPPGWGPRSFVVKDVGQESEHVYVLRREDEEFTTRFRAGELPGFPTTTGVEFLRDFDGRIGVALIVRNQWGETQIGRVDEISQQIFFDDVLEFAIVERKSQRSIVAVTITKILGPTTCPTPDPAETLETTLTNCFRARVAVGTYEAGGVGYSSPREVVVRMTHGYSLLTGDEDIEREFDSIRGLDSPEM